ncbi:MAG: methionyl-tRNA formyltransferase [Candidatus Saccharimonadales bacterium]
MTHHEIPKDPIVFFGTDAFSVPSLIRLLAEGWNIVAVVTKPDAPTGRGRLLTAPAVKRLAEAAGIPVLQPVKLADIEPDLAEMQATIGIVVAYGKIISAAMLELFQKGFINVHSSLLPRYRGAAPIEAAILNGDSETGVTLMQLEPGMDTGPTYDQTRLQLDGTENRETLYEHLAELGAELLCMRLPAILDGQIVPIPQDESAATAVSRISKEAGLIDWSKPGEVIEREIRGYLGWPGSRTHIAGTDVTITKVHLRPGAGSPGLAFVTDDHELAVYTSDGALVIDTLKPAGKREMPGTDFLRGHSL